MNKIGFGNKKNSIFVDFRNRRMAQGRPAHCERLAQTAPARGAGIGKNAADLGADGELILLAPVRAAVIFLSEGCARPAEGRFGVPRVYKLIGCF